MLISGAILTGGNACKPPTTGVHVQCMLCVQWNLSNLDVLGTRESVLIIVRCSDFGGWNIQGKLRDSQVSPLYQFHWFYCIDMYTL